MKYILIFSTSPPPDLNLCSNTVRILFLCSCFQLRLCSSHQPPQRRRSEKPPSLQETHLLRSETAAQNPDPWPVHRTDLLVSASDLDLDFMVLIWTRTSWFCRQRRCFIRQKLYPQSGLETPSADGEGFKSTTNWALSHNKLSLQLFARSNTWTEETITYRKQSFVFYFYFLLIFILF